MLAAMDERILSRAIYCKYASIALSPEFCGVGIITTDPTAPLRQADDLINEINVTPGLHYHEKLKPPRSLESLQAPSFRMLRLKTGQRRGIHNG